jgi:hypothetical protein
MEAKEIRKFLGDLSDEDYHYTKVQLSMARDARNLITEFSLTEERFCTLLKINGKKAYKSFLNGGYNYTIRDMANMHCAYILLAKERSVEEAEKHIKEDTTNIIP